MLAPATTLLAGLRGRRTKGGWNHARAHATGSPDRRRKRTVQAELSPQDAAPTRRECASGERDTPFPNPRWSRAANLEREAESPLDMGSIRASRARPRRR